MPHLKVHGTEIHYIDTRDSGGAGGGRESRETVVLSHGLFWSGRMYEAQIEALRGRFRCIAFDHRGQGKSAPYLDPYDLEQLYEDAAALVTSLDATPCHWVGLSMGGFVGMRLAARRPDLVRSLALLDTAADPEPAFNRAKYAVLSAVASMVGTKPFVGKIMKTMFSNAFRSDPARASEREEMKRRLLANDGKSSINALSTVCHRRSIEAEVPSIRCPVLVLSGENDVAVSSARSERTAKLIPGAEFRIVPRSGHTSTVEEPAFVSEALLDFYDRIAKDMTAKRMKGEA
jgi:3-oxoadipate enol-lactonase